MKPVDCNRLAGAGHLVGGKLAGNYGMLHGHLSRHQADAVLNRLSLARIDALEGGFASSKTALIR